MMKSEIFTAIASRCHWACIAGQLRRTIQIATGFRQWGAFVGGPLTPSGCAILAVMLAAILLAAILSTFWARVGVGSVFRVGCWFS
ncbi:hypothetical protein BH160DRAFT_2414 [Burkholderia sp. H160]|nr:hypothetical protein BH160DRAFT_2414 [Burkholderia sp. H160]